jgi:hypothetical protein
MQTDNLDALNQQISEHEPRLRQLDDAQMLKSLKPGDWSGKELLGHMTDSAAINRQRIVRSQYEAPYDFPAYEQATWTQVQAFNTYAWDELVTLWAVEFRHLVHVATHLPQESAASRCPVKFWFEDWVTLDWLLGHMTNHNSIHLDEIYSLVEGGGQT